MGTCSYIDFHLAIQTTPFGTGMPPMNCMGVVLMQMEHVMEQWVCHVSMRMLHYKSLAHAVKSRSGQTGRAGVESASNVPR